VRIMRTIQRLMLSVMLVVSAIALAPAAGAKAGDVIRTGACSGASDWKLKLSPEDNGIQLEFEVDSNRVGQTWRIRLRQNGGLIFSGTRVTKAPSGSFTVRRLAHDTAGTDAFRAAATNVATGETCVGRASIG
jgi:hypothetical protein